MVRAHRPTDRHQTIATARRLDGIEKLAAAVLMRALEDCRSGDALACAWLEYRALSWIEAVSPSDVDPVIAHANLINRLPNSELTLEQASKRARYEFSLQSEQLELEMT